MGRVHKCTMFIILKKGEVMVEIKYTDCVCIYVGMHVCNAKQHLEWWRKGRCCWRWRTSSVHGGREESSSILLSFESNKSKLIIGLDWTVRFTLKRFIRLLDIRYNFELWNPPLTGQTEPDSPIIGYPVHP